MNNFLPQVRTLLADFLDETKHNAIWLASELKHQYQLSILREISEAHPKLKPEIERIIDWLECNLDGLDKYTDLSAPDFVEPPDEPWYDFERDSPKPTDEVRPDIKAATPETRINPYY